MTSSRTPGISRRNFLLGSGLAAAAAAGAGLVGCAPQAPAAAPGADDLAATGEGAATAGEGNVYVSIAEQLNPQDYDYRQNSGDLSQVLSPWKLGNMEFSNRIVKSAAGSNYENGGWDAFVEYYRRLAAGGTEMIWVENFAHIFLPYKNAINANIDEFTDEQVRQLTDAIHAEGAKCGTQTDIMGSAFYKEVSARGGHDAQYFTLEEIDYMVDSYVAAAKKFKAWGFDAWELNCAGNNQTQWFFSKSRNHRDDEYGSQTFENRVRFIGQNVTIVGGNMQATDVAAYLMEQGKNVTIVTPENANMLAKGQSIWCKRFALPILYAHGMKVWQESELVSAAGGVATVKTATGTETPYACDTVIEAMDMLPNKAMLDELSGIEAYAVGDCDDPYNIEYAIRAGNFCARAI